MLTTNRECEICGKVQGLDQHHVVSRGMGGRKDPTINAQDNLMTLCRSCHQNIYEGRWMLDRSAAGIRVVDKNSSKQIMRRLNNPNLDVPSLFQVLNVAEHTVSCLLEALPYCTDEELVQAFTYAGSFGKRGWLLQAAVLFEAQKRSTYGERTLEAIARGFDIRLRQAQKYALVWKVFFAEGDEDCVNINAILLDEPSWYVVAVTETNDPTKWLSYAQDRKVEDVRYSVAAFRRDIQVARLTQGIGDVKENNERPIEDCPATSGWACPWIKLLCTYSGKPIPSRECESCEFKQASRYKLT